MALISPVGRRSFLGRLIIACIYLFLTGGAITMVVPFLMTLTASVSNGFDVEKYRLFPKYLWDDEELYLKFLFEKYPSGYFHKMRSMHRLAGVRDAGELIRDEHAASLLPEIRAYHEQLRPDYDRIRTDYYDFLRAYPVHKLDIPCFIYLLRGQWQEWLRGRYLAEAEKMGVLQQAVDPDRAAIDYMNRHYGDVVADSFDSVNFPDGGGYAPRSYWRNDKQAEDYQTFLRQLDVSYVIPQRGDDQYAWFLNNKYGGIDKLNEAWGTAFDDYVEIILSSMPPADPRQLTDWEDFFSRGARLSWVTVSDSFTGAFREFARQRFDAPERAEERLDLPLTSWDELPFTAGYEGNQAYRELWSEFVLKHVPVSERSISYFEKEYAAFLNARYKTAEELSAAYKMPIRSVDEFRPPYAGLDYDEFYVQRSQWRWHFLTNNFVLVSRFITTKSGALWNTLILVALTIAGAVAINPLAAFALSRYRVPLSQAILLFLLLPMAFPAEVSMIPSFLLLRSFPIMILATCLLVIIGWTWFYGLHKSFKLGRISRCLGIVAICAVAVYLTPLLFRIFHLPNEMPLLNSYLALILPGLANGFSIFLLKGFFDGLPRELYEAAQIDGASELLMFRVITFPLAKPIITYTVIGSALAAYGGFMWAFVVVPEEKMWTLMVWLYQFSTDYAGQNMSVVMAALVIASVPTFVFFAFCQRVILRGIVLPTMK